MFGASPQASEAPQNSTMPTTKVRRRPHRSATEAEVIMNMPMVTL